MARIFISYKRIDKEKVLPIADRIRNDLEEPCWMDIDEIESDAQFASVIMNAIDEASVFLFMYSKAHTLIDNYSTDWTIRELNYAQVKNKRIVFVTIDGTQLSNWFVFMFPQKQQVNAQSESDLKKLLRDISQWLKNTNPETKNAHAINVSSQNVMQSDVLSPKCNDNEKLRLNYTVLGIPFTMIKIAEGTYMGETQVTQILWASVIHNNPSRFIGEDNPVDSVSWNDCQLFIDRLNNITKMHFRLPTEAEWEFAAKGGAMSRNYIYSGGDILDEVAWNLRNSKDSTHPVKQKKANELGLFDMSGNVWEWCDDQLEEIVDIDQATTKLTSRTLRIFKGGCWCEIDRCKPTAREAWPPNYKSNGGLGLRLAMTVCHK